MKIALRLGLCLAMGLAAATAWPSNLPTASVQTEDNLIRMLGSSDATTINDALDHLIDDYPKSTNALPAIRNLLKNQRVQRRAAHVLGACHAELEWDEVKVILGFLRAYDINEVMDGLKILRALKEPAVIVQRIVSDILPLLKDPETHVVRDACRTLAVLGNKETIPYIEPLLKDRRPDVRKDAQDALDKLRAKL
jgi:hypothetical protein